MDIYIKMSHLQYLGLDLMFFQLCSSIRWKYFKHLVQHFIHIPPRFPLTCLVCLETLVSLFELKGKSGGFDHSLAAQHEFEMTVPPAGCVVEEVKTNIVHPKT